MSIRKARLSDVNQMHRLINYYAAKNLMLPRTPAQLYESLRDFTVAVDDREGGIIGCGALHFYDEDLAEVRSLAVDERKAGKGIGSQIVKSLIEEAKAQDVKRLCAFTLVPDFFSKLGFKVIPSNSLPQKLFNECIYCPKFNNSCDEIAMILDLDRSPQRHVDTEEGSVSPCLRGAK